MKIEKLPSGSYRVRKVYKGQRHTLVFPYKPSQKEVIEKMNALLQGDYSDNGTMEDYIRKYIKSKQNVLAPSSVYTYNNYLHVISKDFLKKSLGDLTQHDVQTEINRYAETHSPKSVKSLHGFLASVIAFFRPQMVLKTRLPQKIEKVSYLPTESDIKAILQKAKRTEDSIAFQLGVMGLRRSEICALELSDLKGNELHIHANMVWNKRWIKKESPKTDAGNRTIYLPESLVREIRRKGYFFKYSPNKLLEHLHKYQKDLNIPQFRFHDLRHFFASYAATVMPESDAMALGGWKSDYIFKRIYRESLKEKRKESAQKLISGLFS